MINKLFHAIYGLIDSIRIAQNKKLTSFYKIQNLIFIYFSVSIESDSEMNTPKALA